MSPRWLRAPLRRLAHQIAPSELATAVRFLRASSNPIFPKRRVTASSRVEPGKVLVLSPHPDDEAIGMGGALVKHVSAGSDVTVLFLTDGGGLEEPREPLIEARRSESKAVGAHLGIPQIFWDHPDTGLTRDEKTVAELTAVLAELRPDRIFCPSIFDTHFDHFTTCRLLGGALTALPELEAIVEGYEVWDTIPFKNHLLDISDVIEEKDRILAFYEIPHRSTDFTALCRARASVHYTLGISSELDRQGKGFAEAYLCFDAAEYRRLLAEYMKALADSGSELARHP